MPKRMMRPDMYNMMTKTLNSGGLDNVNELEATSFEMFTLDEYDPFAPTILDNLQVYDGGTYANGVSTSVNVNILDGSTYANGTQIPPAAYALNGGTY